MAVILTNTGGRGVVDIDLPGTGKEREIAVRRAKTSEEGIGREVVTRLVKIHCPHGITLAPGERSRPLPDAIVRDPVIASQIRSGILAARPTKDRPTKKAKPTEEAAPKKAKPTERAAPEPMDSPKDSPKGSKKSK